MKEAARSLWLLLTNVWDLRSVRLEWLSEDRRTIERRRQSSRRAGGQEGGGGGKLCPLGREQGPLRTADAAAPLLCHVSNSDIKYRSYLPHVYWTVSVAEEDQKLIGSWEHLVPSNLSNLLALPIESHHREIIMSCATTAPAFATSLARGGSGLAGPPLLGMAA